MARTRQASKAAKADDSPGSGTTRSQEPTADAIDANAGQDMRRLCDELSLDNSILAEPEGVAAAIGR